MLLATTSMCQSYAMQVNRRSRQLRQSILDNEVVDSDEVRPTGSPMALSSSFTSLRRIAHGSHLLCLVRSELPACSPQRHLRNCLQSESSHLRIIGCYFNDQAPTRTSDVFAHFGVEIQFSYDNPVSRDPPAAGSRPFCLVEPRPI